MDERYKALGIEHHEKDTEIEPLEHTGVSATVFVVLLFIAYFIFGLVAIRVLP